MKLSKFVKLVKEGGYCMVVHAEDSGIWLGTRAALFRATELPDSGQPYLVVHDGFEVLAAVMPVQVVTEDFLADLSEFHALCTEQFYRQRDGGEGDAEPEEEPMEQIGMEEGEG